MRMGGATQQPCISILQVRNGELLTGTAPCCIHETQTMLQTAMRKESRVLAVIAWSMALGTGPQFMACVLSDPLKAVIIRSDDEEICRHSDNTRW